MTLTLAAPAKTVWREYDEALLWVGIVMVGTGLVMVYSASIAIAEGGRYGVSQPAYFLMRQLLFVAIGAVAGIMAFQVPMRLWQQTAPYLFLFGAVLLVLVLVPGIGREVNGSRRWLPLIVVNLQPSELTKLFVVLYAADYTVRKAAWMHSFKRGFLPMFAVMLCAGALLLLEPDFGAFAVIAAIAMGVLFLGGMNWRLFAGLAVLLVIGFVVIIVTSPYRMQRILGFLRSGEPCFANGLQRSRAAHQDCNEDDEEKGTDCRRHGPLLEIAPGEHSDGGRDERADVEHCISGAQRHVRRRHRLSVHHLRANIERRQVRQHPVQCGRHPVGNRRLDDLVEIAEVGAEPPGDEKREGEGR